jgi:hypothetical protein
VTERLSCEVPGCRRTRKPNRYPEWICGDHWREVSRNLRRRYTRAKRRRDALRASLIWRMAKEQAIQRAFGI